MKSHDKTLIQIRIFFAIYVTVLCEPSCHPDALSSILHIHLYGFVYQLILYMIFFSFIIFYFSQIYFPTKITNVTMSFTLPKHYVEIQRGFKSLSLLIMCHRAHYGVTVMLGQGISIGSTDLSCGVKFTSTKI